MEAAALANVRALPTSVIERLVTLVVSREQFELGEVSVAIVDDDEMHGLNKKWLQHDYTTDVLTFDLADGDADSIAGEIIVNAMYAQREAAERGHAPELELAFYIAHGVLHLCGHDDTTDEEREAMLERQREYMRELFPNATFNG